MRQVRFTWGRGKAGMSQHSLSADFILGVPQHCSNNPPSERHQKLPCPSPAGDDDGLLPIPGGVVSHDLGVGGDILW